MVTGKAMKPLSQDQFALLESILKIHSPEMLVGITAPQSTWSAELRNALSEHIGDEIARSGMTASYEINSTGRALEQLIDAIVDMGLNPDGHS